MDYEFNPGEIVTAVNRSSKPLSWEFNGQSFVLGPHQEKPLNMTYVLRGIRRLPVMGTFDPAFEQQHESLIGIKEEPYCREYPCTPIEQSANPEAIDRTKLPEDRQNAYIQKVGWESDLQQLAGRNPLVDDGFAAQK